MKVSRGMRGRKEESELGGRQRERKRDAGPGGSGLASPTPHRLVASLAASDQVEGHCCSRFLGCWSRLMETKLLCQPEYQVLSVTQVPLAGNEAGARSPRGGNNRCTDGGREGIMAFSEASLCLWHGTGHFYTHPHFLLMSTPRSEAVIILPS